MARDEEFELRMKGYRLATAEIIYYMPDHPSLVQSFVWQTLDLAPRFPRLMNFLDFWRREIEAVIQSVQVASSGLVSPVRWRAVEGEFRLQ